MTRLATVHQPTIGAGPDGKQITVPLGRYRVADLDGVSDKVLYLQDTAGRLVACVSGADRNVTISEEG